MTQKYRLDNVPSYTGFNPIIENIARIDYTDKTIGPCGCHADNSNGGGGCRSKRTLEDVHQY